MSKKLILFLMVLLFGSTSFLRADEVTIGDPTSTTTSTYLPTYSLYNYSLTQQIYTADEIGMAGTISDVAMWLKNSSSYARNFNIYMKEVSESTFANNSAWVSITDADLVATYTLANGISDPVETTFTLTTPFEYSGNGNLLICVQDVTGSWSSGAASVVMTATNQAIYAYRDASLYDPSNPGVTGTLPTNKSVVRLHIESAPTPPTPPTPTGELTITPNPFTMGYRPVNGWMEPLAVRIYNGGEPVTITASLSNTAGVNAFVMSQNIDNVALATEEEVDFTIDINHSAAAGEYTEEFTMFSVTNSRDITTIPVTATFYQAGEADIVETAYNFGNNLVGDFSHTPANLHPNYFGYQDMLVNDAVYRFKLTKDSKFSVTGGEFIGIYHKMNDFHPTLAVEPVVYSLTGAITEATLLAGEYYMIVAGDAITTVEGTVEQMPAPSALTALLPEDGATDVNAPVTLTWEGGENAAEYQVLFGTSPVNMDVVLDWTIVDANYGSYTIANVLANTQYFWQIKARNTNGTVQTVRRGFTTTLTAPNTVTASEEEIFVDGSTLIKWKHSTGTMGDLPETQIGSGTATSPYLPTYNLYNYSLTEQIYTGEEIGEAGYINSISFHPVGAITRNLKIYMANTDKTSFTSGSDWVAMEADNLVFEGNVEMVANTWVTINLNEPFEFDGSNLIIAVTDHTGTWTSSIQYSTFDATSQAINVYQDSAPYSATAPAGSGTVRAFKNQIIINKDGAKGNTMNRGFLGYNVYYGDVKANTSLISEKQFLLENLPYNVEPGHDINVTAVYDEGESGHSTPIVTVKVSGYATLTGTVTTLATTQAASVPVAGATVKFTGKDEFNNDVIFETTTNSNGVYSVIVKAGTYNRGVATLDGMEPAYMEAPVTVAYEGTETVNFTIHEEYKPVLSVYAEEIDPSLAKVQWSLNTAISGGGVGGNGDEFTVNFDNSAIPAGWTMIDANNDGYNWVLGSAIGGVYLVSGASLAGSGHNSSADMICSGSYSNATNQAITPDNYLVTPQVMLVPGSTFSFWACAQDASYAAEHYGVFVADNPTGPWTMVQEWTMTAKGEGTMGIGRDGQTRAQGNWYQKSVDLSAFAGQKYIAIRHFNCNDQFILDVDDIELSVSSKDRSVETYAVYRKAILKEEAIVPADSVYFGNTTDTLYADFDWNNQLPGLYQYGVSAIYPSAAKGNRSDELTVYEGTTTNNHVPMYVFYFDDWTRSQFVIPAADLADVAGGTITALKFYTTASNIPYTTVSPFDFFVKEVDYTEISAYEAKESCEIVYSGTGDFVAEGDGGMITITFNTPYSYNGGNLLIGCENTSDSGYKNIYFYGTTVSGASISGSNGSSTAAATVNQQNFIPMTTIVYEAGSGGGGNDNPVTPITWSNILPKDMETTVTVNALMAAGTPEGATLIMTNGFENLAIEGEFDETGTLVFEGFRKGDWVVTVDLVGYTSDIVDEEISIWDETTINANLTEIYKPVDDVSVSVTGFATWTDIVPADRMPEKYFVQLNGVYYAETTDNFMQIDEEILDLDETYTFGVAVVYSTGMSNYVTTTFTYLGCEGVATQVEDLAVDSAYCQQHLFDVALVWNGGTPTPTPPTPPTGTDFNFDDGTFMGWTTIDANNDGYNWVMGSQIGGVYLVSGASLAGSGHNSSADMICSGSYSNATNQAITPDNYLVSPAKGAYTGISFWACAQDASYAAEHYGVAVSTAGNTSASDFTIVDEWTMTAKGDGAMSIGRDGQTRAQGSWYQKTVDLSAYAGQEIWIAIRHFNCNDQFILNVDDITLGTPDKNATAETCGVAYPSVTSRAQWDLLKDFNGTSGYQYGVATDGQFIYTSSWSASSTSMFYKYDMDGNFVEEFNVSGCGQIRDLTYDGQYFYGVANSSVIYCVDLANHTLVGQTTSAYGAMRCCSYDSERDGFWVVGNWSGNLTLVDRTGAIVFTGPAPTSASGVAYYKDNDGIEHVLCFNNADNGVYDYNITTNVMGGQVFNYNNAPGTGSGSSGGCHVANYGDKLAFYGDIQASPQYIAIYELGEAQGGGGQITSDLTPNKFNIMVDGEIVGATSNNSFIWTVEDGDYSEHEYTVFYVDALYGVSCEQTVVYAVENIGVNETDEVVNSIYPNPTSGDLHINATALTRISIVNTMGQVVYEQNVSGNEAVIDMAKFEAGVYMVNIFTENGSSVKRVTVVK